MMIKREKTMVDLEWARGEADRKATEEIKAMYADTDCDEARALYWRIYWREFKALSVP